MYYIFLHTQPPSSTLQVHKNSYETCQDYKPDQSMSVVMLNLRKILYFASHHFTSHLGTRLEIIVLHDILLQRESAFRKKNFCCLLIERKCWTKGAQFPFECSLHLISSLFSLSIKTGNIFFLDGDVLIKTSLTFISDSKDFSIEGVFIQEQLN